MPYVSGILVDHSQGGLQYLRRGPVVPGQPDDAHIRIFSGQP